ncbi:lens fiber membrane intrinsic protein [Falco peregrinus]|uniref:lens fiber membrane intrinsic protein n=1 Tax=Falco peregrinus TaxID=8954 RepID=UPI002479AF3E|nr:lens fiber membrane intrinsic protein [Falco peregrinus]
MLLSVLTAAAGLALGLSVVASGARRARARGAGVTLLLAGLLALLGLAVYTAGTLSLLGPTRATWRFSWSYILGWGRSRPHRLSRAFPPLCCCQGPVSRELRSGGCLRAPGGPPLPPPPPPRRSRVGARRGAGHCCAELCRVSAGLSSPCSPAPTRFVPFTTP